MGFLFFYEGLILKYPAKFAKFVLLGFYQNSQLQIQLSINVEYYTVTS